MNYATISEMFYDVVTTFKDKKIYYYKDGAKWKGLTGTDIKSIVQKISLSLYKNEVNPQDKVAILSNTSYKWA